MASLDEVLDKYTDDSADMPVTCEIEAPELKKPISAHLWIPSPVKAKLRLVIVSHGAGGTSLSPANRSFCDGLACAEPPLLVIAYDGSSNLPHRTKALRRVIQWSGASDRLEDITLAGRSMGCRASAIACKQAMDAGEITGATSLILESYPLLGKKQDERKQVLVDLASTTSVLFITGSKDEMCPQPDLKEVCQAGMEASTSRVVVTDMNHGMSLTGAGKVEGGSKQEISQKLGKRAGQLAAEWLYAKDKKQHEYAELAWIDGDEHFSEWHGTKEPPNKREASPREASPDDPRPKRTRR